MAVVSAVTDAGRRALAGQAPNRRTSTTMGIDLDNDGKIDSKVQGPIGVDIDNDGIPDILIDPQVLVEFAIAQNKLKANNALNPYPTSAAQAYTPPTPPMPYMLKTNDASNPYPTSTAQAYTPPAPPMALAGRDVEIRKQPLTPLSVKVNRTAIAPTPPKPLPSRPDYVSIQPLPARRDLEIHERSLTPQSVKVNRTIPRSGSVPRYAPMSVQPKIYTNQPQYQSMVPEQPMVYPHPHSYHHPPPTRPAPPAPPAEQPMVPQHQQVPIQERVVEKPVVQTKIQERVVEKPIVVEKPVYVEKQVYVPEHHHHHHYHHHYHHEARPQVIKQMPKSSPDSWDFPYHDPDPFLGCDFRSHFDCDDYAY